MLGQSPRPWRESAQSVRGGWPCFGVRGQSAAATPLWLTRPSTCHRPLVCPQANSRAARAGIPQGHRPESQSAVAASLCRRTPYSGAQDPAGLCPPGHERSQTPQPKGTGLDSGRSSCRGVRGGDGAGAFWSVTLRNPGPGGQGVGRGVRQGVGRGAYERTVTDAWTGQPKRGRRCALPPHSKTETTVQELAKTARAARPLRFPAGPALPDFTF